MHNACVIIGGHLKEEKSWLYGYERKIIRCNLLVVVPAALQSQEGNSTLTQNSSKTRKVVLSFSVSRLSAKNVNQRLGLDER